MSATSQRLERQRALRIALGANAAFLVAEVAAGFIFNSLALLADAAHMLSDVAALAIALVAQRLSERPATARHTFGLQRAEVVGAQVNAVLLLGVAAWIAFEAVGRFSRPPEVAGTGLLVVATGGLAVNVYCALLLARTAGHSVNMRGAVLHMALDAAGSVGAIGAGLAIVAADVRAADPVASVAIVGLVIWSALRLLNEATHVLMEGAPRHLDSIEIESFIAADPSVESVHHVHVWNLASDVPALSAHVVLGGDVSLHEAQIEGDRLRTRVLERFGIEHTTFELECHACEEPPADVT